MSRTRDRKRARLNEQRAREAKRAQDAKRARTLERRAHGYDRNGWDHKPDHDLTRGFAPHGTHKQSPITGREVTLIRAWDEDRVRWDKEAGLTRVMPRFKKVERVVEHLERADKPRAQDRRVWNTPGRNSGWDDSQAKAEKGFARELRIARMGG